MKKTTIYTLLPNAEELLALEPEELAGVVLEVLDRKLRFESSHRGKPNRYNFTLPQNFRDYPGEYQEQVARAVMVAWNWLEREGLIVSEPGENREWVFITPRGQKIATRTKLEEYRKGNLLPRKQLHPVIAQKVWATFLRGDYDTAVFQSFKEVEVAVRQAGGYNPTDIGTDLMRKAFHVDTGPLTDKNVPKAERQALSDLFAGAIGSYKNPGSHRNVVITAEEAVEMIVLASHLLRIVDERSSNI